MTTTYTIKFDDTEPNKIVGVHDISKIDLEVFKFFANKGFICEKSASDNNVVCAKMLMKRLDMITKGKIQVDGIFLYSHCKDWYFYSNLYLGSAFPKLISNANVILPEDIQRIYENLQNKFSTSKEESAYIFDLIKNNSAKKEQFIYFYAKICYNFFLKFSAIATAIDNDSNLQYILSTPVNKKYLDESTRIAKAKGFTLPDSVTADSRMNESSTTSTPRFIRNSRNSRISSYISSTGTTTITTAREGEALGEGD